MNILRKNRESMKLYAQFSNGIFNLYFYKWGYIFGLQIKCRMNNEFFIYLCENDFVWRYAALFLFEFNYYI